MSGMRRNWSGKRHPWKPAPTKAYTRAFEDFFGGKNGPGAPDESKAIDASGDQRDVQGVHLRPNQRRRNVAPTD